MFQLTDFNAKTQDQIRRQLAAEDAARAVGAGTPQSAQPDRRRQSQDRSVEGPAPRLGYRISLIQFRRRLLDEHDSMRFAVKPTVDNITRFLGYTSDDHPNLKWEYGQTLTKGSEGTAVKIEMIWKSNP